VASDVGAVNIEVDSDLWLANFPGNEKTFSSSAMIQGHQNRRIRTMLKQMQGTCKVERSSTIFCGPK
jgi:hypothetical protein